MVKTCSVYLCQNRKNELAKENSISFFRFPKNFKNISSWIKALKRKGWEPKDHSYVCSTHFVDGWHGDEPNDLNYAPTLFAYKAKSLSKPDSEIQERSKQRESLKVFLFNIHVPFQT